MTQGEETSAGTAGSGQPPPTPAAHQQIGRYKILRELGRGAMGVVYEAVDPKIGRKVALKVLHDVAGISASELEEFRSRFFREARTAGMLSHRNIVVIHDVDHDERLGITYMAMELLKGQSIRDLLRSGVKFTTEQAFDVCIQVAEGLDHAHRQGIVHRDVKPDNLMLLEDGTVKITDFGIAKISTSNLTRTGQFIGTPNYMLPEQVIGHVIDGRSDLFSLGIILYELLTGEKPFMGSSLTTITYQIVNVDPIEPSKIRPGIAKFFDGIVAKLLKKAPDERFQTGKEVAEALRATRDGGAAAAAASSAAAAGAQSMSQSGVGGGDVTHVSGPMTSAGTAVPTVVSGPARTGQAPEPAAARGGMGKILVAGVAAVIVLGALGVMVFKMGGRNNQPGTGASGPATTTSPGPAASGPATTPGTSGVPGASGATAASGSMGVSGTAAATQPSGATGPRPVPPTGASGASAATGKTGASGPATPPRTRPNDSLPPLIIPPAASMLPPQTTKPKEPEAAPVSTASVNLTFEHKLKSGTLSVLVDGKQVMSLDVASDKKMKKETASGHFTVPEGRHEVKLCLTSPEIDDGPKCAYKQFAFVMNRTATIHAEHGKPMMGGKHWFLFTIE